MTDREREALVTKYGPYLSMTELGRLTGMSSRKARDEARRLGIGPAPAVRIPWREAMLMIETDPGTDRLALVDAFGVTGAQADEILASASEYAVLKRRYVPDGAAACAAELGIAEQAVRKKARRYGLDERDEPWTDDQIEFLVENAPAMSVGELARGLGRTVPAVNSMISALRSQGREVRLKRNAGTRMDAGTVEKVRRMVQDLHLPDAAVRTELRMSQRTVSAIRRSLGLNPSGHDTGPWTAADDAWLRANGQTLTLTECSKRLGRTRDAVAQRIHRLGLSRPKDPSWSPSDIETVRRFAFREITARQAANALRRTEAAVKTKTAELRSSAGSTADVLEKILAAYRPDGIRLDADGLEPAAARKALEDAVKSLRT